MVLRTCQCKVQYERIGEQLPPSWEYQAQHQQHSDSDTGSYVTNDGNLSH